MVSCKTLIVTCCQIAISMAIHRENQAFEGLSDLIANIVTLDNTELVFISDFVLPKQVINKVRYLQ